MDNRPKTTLEEFEFPNTLTGRLRSFVHGIAGKWPLRHLIQQQNAVNRAQGETGDYLKTATSAIDHELTETRKQLAALTTVVLQLQKKIEQLENGQEQSEQAGE